MSVMSIEDDNASFFLSRSFGGSTITELSSIFSMSEDDFDKMASRHAQVLFDEIDSMLFEHPSNSGPPHLVRECHEWRAKFPHLRVLGHQVLDHEDDGFHIYPATNSMSPGVADMRNAAELTESKELDSAALLVHGKHFYAVQPGTSVSVNGRGAAHSNDRSLMNTMEEVLEENGTMEEILAIDYKTGDDDSRTVDQKKYLAGRPPVTPFNCVKDNIMFALFNRVLNKVVPAMKPLLKRLLETAAEKGLPDVQSGGEPLNDLELSMNSNGFAEKSFRSSLFANSMLSSVPEETPLVGVLTVRSKTLLNRERTMGVLDGMMETFQSQTMPGMRLNPVSFGNSHLSERRSSLNRIKLSPLENAKLHALAPPGETDQTANVNLEGLRGHRLATLTPQTLTTPMPKLPPLQSQRIIMSANVPNTNINRSMQNQLRVNEVQNQKRVTSQQGSRLFRQNSSPCLYATRPKVRPFYCHSMNRLKTSNANKQTLVEETKSAIETEAELAENSTISRSTFSRACNLSGVDNTKRDAKVDNTRRENANRGCTNRDITKMDDVNGDVIIGSCKSKDGFGQRGLASVVYGRNSAKGKRHVMLPDETTENSGKVFNSIANISKSGRDLRRNKITGQHGLGILNKAVADDDDYAVTGRQNIPLAMDLEADRRHLRSQLEDFYWNEQRPDIVKFHDNDINYDEKHSKSENHKHRDVTVQDKAVQVSMWLETSPLLCRSRSTMKTATKLPPSCPRKEDFLSKESDMGASPSISEKTPRSVVVRSTKAFDKRYSLTGKPYPTVLKKSIPCDKTGSNVPHSSRRSAERPALVPNGVSRNCGIADKHLSVNYGIANKLHSLNYGIVDKHLGSVACTSDRRVAADSVRNVQHGLGIVGDSCSSVVQKKKSTLSKTDIKHQATDRLRDNIYLQNKKLISEFEFRPCIKQTALLSDSAHNETVRSSRPSGKVCCYPCGSVCVNSWGKDQSDPHGSMCDNPCDKVCGYPCSRACGNPDSNICCNSWGKVCGYPCSRVCGNPHSSICGNPWGREHGDPCGSVCKIPRRKLCGNPLGKECGNPYNTVCGNPFDDTLESTTTSNLRTDDIRSAFYGEISSVNDSRVQNSKPSQMAYVSACRDAQLDSKSEVVDVQSGLFCKNSNRSPKQSDSDSGKFTTSNSMQNNSRSFAGDPQKSGKRMAEPFGGVARLHRFLDFPDDTAVRNGSHALKAHSCTSQSVAPSTTPYSPAPFNNRFGLIPLESSFDNAMAQGNARSDESDNGLFHRLVSQRSVKNRKSNRQNEFPCDAEDICDKDFAVWSDESIDLGRNKPFSRSMIPRPVMKHGQSVSQVCELANRLPDAWARAMHPFIQVFKSSSEAYDKRSSADQYRQPCSRLPVHSSSRKKGQRELRRSETDQ